MGLRLRLNLVLLPVFLAALLVAVFLLLSNARQAVVEELRASTALVAALLESAQSDSAARLLVEHLNRSQSDASLRHMRVVDSADGRPAPTSSRAPERVPKWFFRLVEPDAEALERDIAVAGASLRIVANPADEIAEAWREIRVTLGLIAALFVVANAAVSLSIGRILRPLTEVSRALSDVEHGDYAVRLPASGNPDIDVINERFNQMSAVLAASERDKAALAQRSLAIQEEERRYLARELHDDMGQSVTAIKALAVSIRERADIVIGERADTIIEVSSSIYDRVRQMMTRLHPAVLDELGLNAALAQMIDDWNAHHAACFCHLRVAVDEQLLDATTRINVFRIVQEGLTNIARHARATEARIEVLETGGLLRLSIEDDGDGFDTEGRGAGLGLLGIRERVRALDGRFALEAALGKGVHITAEIPLAQRAATEAA